MTKKRQGDRLIAILKKRGLTTMEIQMIGISTCWHKRVAECLSPNEFLDSYKNSKGINVYRVVEISLDKG